MGVLSLKRLLKFSHGKLGEQKYTRFPPSVQELLQHKETIDGSVVPRDGTDAALIALFSIYVALITGKQLWFRIEVERFWNHHDWKVCEIQDPCDPDPIRYAVLATIPYLLVRAFNANIELGLPRDAPPLWTYEEEIEFRARPKCFESVPDWAKKVPALATQLLLPNAAGHLPSGNTDPTADPDMLRKNILTKWQPTAFI